ACARRDAPSARSASNRCNGSGLRACVARNARSQPDRRRGRGKFGGPRLAPTVERPQAGPPSRVEDTVGGGGGGGVLGAPTAATARARGAPPPRPPPRRPRRARARRARPRRAATASLAVATCARPRAAPAEQRLACGSWSPTADGAGPLAAGRRGELEAALR